jgi:hypothetical protein
MNYTLIFQIINIIVLPFWLTMIIAPHSNLTHKLNRGYWQFIPLAVIYTLLIVPAFGDILPAVANPQLDNIVALLSNDFGITLVWLHILVWDLFVGRFLWLDTIEHNKSILKLRIALFFTLMSGPLGLLLYMAMSGIQKESKKL